MNKDVIYKLFSNFYLDEKLNNLDAMYSNRQGDLTSMSNLSTEEKLLLFQKNVELKTKENFKEQVKLILQIIYFTNSRSYTITNF